MDSISRREEEKKITYCISGDPTLPHHLQTLVNAQDKFGRPVTLALVLNVLKTDRLFSVKESTELAKKLAEEMGVSLAEIVCLDTKEKVTECLKNSDVIIRRKEKDLSSDSPYIQEMAKRYDVLGFPDKIEWMESDSPSNNTSGKLKALVYNSINNADPAMCEVCHKKARKIAPEFLVEAIEKKMKDNPDKKHFPLSVDEDLKEALARLISRRSN